MKNKILILLAIAVFALASCGDDDNGGGVKPHGAPYDHLGIGEPRGADCGDNCAYKNYNTSTGENAFPKPIYRVGANADGYGDAEIQSAANKIISAYGNNTNGVIKMDVKDVDHFKAILTQPAQIVSGNGAYSLDGGTLKISVNGSADIADFLKDKAVHDHLGIDEAKCTATAGCELKNYKPTEGKYANFPYDIFRVGALTELDYPGNTLSDSVNDIVMVYFGDKVYDDGEGGIYEIDSDDRVLLGTRPLNTIHVLSTKSADARTLNQAKTIFGSRAGSADVNLITRFKQLANDEMPSNVAQLQPAGNIRLALSGALRSSVESEQFPAVAARRKWVSVAETV